MKQVQQILLRFSCLVCLSLILSWTQATQAQTPDLLIKATSASSGDMVSRVYGTAIDASGNVYVTGYFKGSVAFGTTTLVSAGNNDIFLAKYDNTGAFQWAKRAGGTSDDRCYGVAVSGNDVYITGNINDATSNFNTPSATGSNEVTSAGADDIFLAKYNSAGAFQWVKRAGGTSADIGYGVAVSGSDVFITGNIGTGTANFNTPSATGSNEITSAGSEDIFIAKYDDTGAFQWAKRAGGTANDYGYGVAVSGSDVFITGTFNDIANFNTPSATGSNQITRVGGRDIFLAKYDNTGAFQWAKRAGGGSDDQGNGIAVSGSDVYLTGYIGTGTTNFNTPSATGSNEITSAGNTDIFLAKYNNTGAFQWAKRAGGTSDDQGYGVAVSGSDVFITGYIYTGTANFNTPSATGSNEITSAGAQDIFLAKYDNTGAFQWAKRAGGTSDEQGYGVAVSGSNAYITGYFKGTANFNTPSASGSNQLTTTASNGDAFIARYANAVLPGVALNFDGVNDQVLAPSSTPTLATNSFTLEAWVNPTASYSLDGESTTGYAGVESAKPYLLYPAQQVSDAGVGIAVGTNGIGVYELADNHAPCLLSWAGTVSGWTHVAVICDNKQYKLYVNGTLVRTGLTSIKPNTVLALGTTNANNPNLLSIGGGIINFLPSYYQGSLDEFRVWNRVLAPCEIQAHKDCELGNSQTGLQAYYKFNQSSGTTLTDDSGNNNTCTLSNFALTGSTSNWVTTGGVTTGTTCTALPTPSVSITANPSGTITAGTSVTFTPTPTNGGTSPQYQWKNGSTTVGTGATYTSSTLANGDVITCVLTPSAEICTLPATATSTGITMSVTGTLPGAALNFDGNDDYVSIPTNTAFDFADGTVELWAKSLGNTADNALICNRNSGGARWSYHLKNTQLAFYNGTTAVYWTNTFTTGTWYHIAFVESGSTTEAFVNGVSLGAQALTSGTATGLPVNIGSNGVNDEYFNGSIDEVRIWNRALPACEILAHKDCELGSGQIGLQAYYKFNQSSGTSLTDDSGNSRTGTLSNFALTGTTSNWVTTGGVTTGTTCTALLTPSVSIAVTAGSQTPCSNGSVTFTATPTNGGTSPTYQWQKNGANVGTNSDTYTNATWSTTSNDVITCIITNNAACPATATSNSLTITTNNPTIAFTGATSACSSVSLTATGGATYAWSGGNTPSSATNTFTTSGTYTVSVTNSNGCVGTANQVVTVNTPPTVSISNTGATACLGTAALSLNSSNTASQIQWYNGTTLVNTATATPATTGTTVAGGFGSDNNQLNAPSGVYIDEAGNIYVADKGNNRIQKFAAGATTATTVAGGNGGGSADNQLYAPSSVYVDAVGNIYVAEEVNHRISKWAPGATTGITVATTGFLGTPSGIYIDAAGNMYVADKSQHRIQKWTPGASTGITVAGDNGDGSALNQLDNPSGVYVDAAGNIYICDQYNHRIQKWAAGATTGTTIAGGNGNGSDANQLFLPSGFYVDAAGNIYVSDQNNFRIQKFAAGATTGTTVAGGNGAGTAKNQLYYPGGIFLDASGNIYIADAANNRIQKWGSGAAAATYTPTTAGSYTAFVTDANGCTATTAAFAVNATVTPSVSIAITAGSQTTCSNSSVTFTATPTNGGTTPQYQWQKNGANVGTNSDTYTNATWSTTNNDAITCIMTSNAACAATTTVTSNSLAITANNGTVAAITGTATACSSVSLTATGGVTYAWSGGNTPSSATNTFTTSGTYTVSVTNTSGCTATDAIVVTVDNTVPSANAGTDVIVNCTTPSTTLTATGGTAYAWNNSATQGGSVTPTASTTYTVTVTAANGCTATDDVVVTVDNTAPSVNAGTDVIVNCTTPSTTLTATGGTAYAWNNSATQGGSVTPTSTTTYTVTVTAANGCTATDDIVVTVDNTTPSANAGMDVIVNCTMPSTTLTATGGVSYVWNNSATQGSSVTPTATTTYTVTVTAANGCTATDDVVVTVDNTAPTLFNFSGSVHYCAGSNGVDVGLANSESGVTYQLKKDNADDGAPVSGTGSAIFFGNKTAAGTYTVVATRIDGACTATMNGNTIISIDETLPAFVTANVPANITLNCTDVIPAAVHPTATSGCSTVSMIETSTKGTDISQCSFYSYIITRTWTATDKRNNTATVSQVITVQDNTKPVITPLSIITVSEALIPTTVTTTDCMASPTVTFTDIKVTNTPPPCKNYAYTLSRTWKVTDACGNSSTATQTIKAQGIILTCPSDKTINTNSDGVNNYNCSTLATAAMGVAPTFTDGCDAAVLRYTITGATTGTGNGSVAGIAFAKGISKITYSLVSNASDECSLNLTVKDNEGPKITLIPTVVLDACTMPDPIPDTYKPIVLDNCTGTNTLEVMSDVLADQTGCATKVTAQRYIKLLTRTWKATDANGITATAVQKIYLRDMMPPITVCKNVTVNISSSNITLPVSSLNNGSNDNCTAATALTFVGCMNTTACTNFAANLTLKASMIPAGQTQTIIPVLVKSKDACGNQTVTPISTIITLKRIGTMNNATNGSENSMATQDTESSIPAEASTTPTVQGEMKCYPTPFTDDLNIQYNLTETIENVTLKVFDNQGRLVTKMEQEAQATGFYQVRWNLSDLQAGMYHVCLELNGKCTKMERVIMMK